MLQSGMLLPMQINSLLDASAENPPSTATLVLVQEGAPGIAQTLAMMAELSHAGKYSTVVRETALSLISPLDQKDWAAEVRALHAFVRDRIRYVSDPEDVELLQTPEKTLELRAGDCDDKSILLASLLKSINHPCRYRAVGTQPGIFEHVYVETKIRDFWLPLETTEPVEPGWQPPEHSIVMSMYRRA